MSFYNGTYIKLLLLISLAFNLLKQLFLLQKMKFFSTQPTEFLDTQKKPDNNCDDLQPPLLISPSHFKGSNF